MARVCLLCQDDLETQLPKTQQEQQGKVPTSRSGEAGALTATSSTLPEVRTGDIHFYSIQYESSTLYKIR